MTNGPSWAPVTVVWPKLSKGLHISLLDLFCSSGRSVQLFSTFHSCRIWGTKKLSLNSIMVGSKADSWTWPYCCRVCIFKLCCVARGSDTNELLSHWSLYQFLKKFLFLFYVFKCFCLHICLHHVLAWCPWRSENGIRTPRTGVLNSCEPPHECWKMNPVL